MSRRSNGRNKKSRAPWFCIASAYTPSDAPEAELYHYESASRSADGRGDNRYEEEIRHLQRKWGGSLEDDPYYNPNLTLDDSNFAPRAGTVA